LYTRNQKYANYVSHVVFLIFLGVILKKFFGLFKKYLPRYIIQRPKGAFACNVNEQVSCEHEVGMPSIHSMIAGYYSVKYNNNLLILFALSRLGKNENPVFYHSENGCHTIPQIMAGYTLGYAFALIT
jgi:hypothetical protein